MFLRWTWMMHLSRRMILLKRWKMNLKRCVSSSVALLELYFFANLFIHYIGNVNVWIWDCADSDCWYWAWWACKESHEWDQCRQVPRISCPYLNMNCMYIFSLPTWHFSNTHCKLIRMLHLEWHGLKTGAASWKLSSRWHITMLSVVIHQYCTSLRLIHIQN